MKPPGAAIFLGLVFLSSASVSAAGALEDTLWRKAISIASSNVNWVPGLVVMRNEVLRKGEAVGVHELWRRSSLGTNDEVVTRTIKVLEDGKDVTAKETKKNDAGSDRKKIAKLGGHPFDVKVQDQLVVKPTQQSRIISGRSCVAYEFELRNTKGPVVKGTTWLEHETGWPAEIENMTFDPLPDKHFKRMATTARYESSPEGRWQTKEVITTGTVSVMFIKADVRSTTTYSDYFKAPPRVAAGEH